VASAGVASKLGMERLKVSDEELLVFAIGKEQWGGDTARL